MIEQIKVLLEKYKAIILYGIFGVLTTLINIVVYEAFYRYVGWSNVVSNIAAWVAAVTVAFITNKLWVFESKTTEKKTLMFEIISFFGCRLATGLLDLAIMYVAVDELALNSTLMKCISNVIVIIVNYIASKLIIFKNGGNADA